MARSPRYFYDLMIAEKNTFSTLNSYQPNVDSSQTMLNDLKSNSVVSDWRLIFWVVATMASALDVLFELAKIAMAALAEKSRYGTLPWWVTVAKEFQYGDSLTQVNLEWVYSPVVEANRVVTFAAAKEADGIVNVKVARLVSGNPAPLSNVQAAAFSTYVNQKKPAGITVQVINETADDLRLFLNVNYDPLILAPTGELLSTSGSYPVRDAVESYIKNLPFDGKLELMGLIDAVQALECVTSAYVTNAEARYGSNSFVPFTERYYPRAGYMVIHSGTPLSGSITYTADV
jgi:hypothetical protein